jgi:hypothetical protein
MENLENKIENKIGRRVDMIFDALKYVTLSVFAIGIGQDIGKRDTIPVHYENKSVEVSPGYVNPQSIRRVYTEDLNKDGRPETVIEYKDGEKIKSFILQYDGQRIFGTPYEITINKK